MLAPANGVTWKQFFLALKERFIKDKLMDVAGSVTFFGVLALFPFLLFLVTLALLRGLTNSLAATEMDFPPAVQQGGAAFFGVVTGYLVAGFLVCAIQTLPLSERFLGFV